MKTITLTESEIETLYHYLDSNPCRATCVHDYKRINCFDLDKDGKHRCKLMRDTDSIMEKLETKGEQNETVIFNRRNLRNN